LWAASAGALAAIVIRDQDGGAPLAWLGLLAQTARSFADAPLDGSVQADAARAAPNFICILRGQLYFIHAQPRARAADIQQQHY